MKIKFCGMRRDEDIAYANSLRPDYIGMICTPGFRRSVSKEQAKRLCVQKCGCIQAVGVFVDQTAEEIMHFLGADTYLDRVPLDIIQLHGHEDRALIGTLRRETGLPVWKAVRVRSAQDIAAADQLGADMLVLEGYAAGIVGGGGVQADWAFLAQNRPAAPFLLAGGLTPENVREAVRIVKPHGIDISSGIETDGVKDYRKMAQIFTSVT